MVINRNYLELPTEKSRIAILDNSVMFRSLVHLVLTDILNTQPTIYEFSSHNDLMVSLNETAFAFLITDIRQLDDVSDFFEIIQKRNPGLKIMAITSDITKEMIYVSLKAGISSFVLKESSIEQIYYAIEQFLSTGAFLDSRITQLVIDLIKESVDYKQSSIFNRILTPREKQICEYALKGMTNKQIASELVISKSTVDNHFINLYRKLGITKRTQLLDLFSSCDLVHITSELTEAINSG